MSQELVSNAPVATEVADQPAAEAVDYQAEERRKLDAGEVGRETMKLVQMPDGSIVTQEAYHAETKAGNNIVSDYGRAQ